MVLSLLQSAGGGESGPIGTVTVRNNRQEQKYCNEGDGIYLFVLIKERSGRSLWAP